MEIKLYEIADRYREALRELSDLDLPLEVVQDTLEALTGEFTQKARNVGAMVLLMQGEAELIKTAMARMERRRKALENRAEALRDYLKVQMEKTGIGEVKSPEFVLRLRQNPPRVVCDNEALIPRQFKRIERLVHIDKNALRATLLEGTPIRGAHLEQGTRLDIG